MSKDAIDEVSKVLDEHIQVINAEQISNTVAVDTGTLKRGNKFDITDRKYKEIFNNTNYAAYVEFGTGNMVEVPNELKQYAMQFKGKGIKRRNYPASPFFFAPFFKRRQKILRDIVKVLQKFGK